MAAELGALQVSGEAGLHPPNLVGWPVTLNHLKLVASAAVPRIVHWALQRASILGSKNDAPYSVGCHYRDKLSASLSVSNGRILVQSASILLVYPET